MDGVVQYANGTAHTQSVRDALDVRVLGVYSGSALNQLDLALIRYRQASPGAPLCLETLQVCVMRTAILRC
jgi:hypothetical protein